MRYSVWSFSKHPEMMRKKMFCILWLASPTWFRLFFFNCIALIHVVKKIIILLDKLLLSFSKRYCALIGVLEYWISYYYKCDKLVIYVCVCVCVTLFLDVSLLLGACPERGKLTLILYECFDNVQKINNLHIWDIKLCHAHDYINSI